MVRAGGAGDGHLVVLDFYGVAAAVGGGQGQGFVLGQVQGHGDLSVLDDGDVVLLLLGFVVGGNVQVINRLGGNVIVNVKESRVAISEEMARKIMI